MLFFVIHLWEPFITFVYIKTQFCCLKIWTVKGMLHRYIFISAFHNYLYLIFLPTQKSLYLLPKMCKCCSLKKCKRWKHVCLILKIFFLSLVFYVGIMRQMSLNWKDILTLLCVLTGKYIKIIKIMVEKIALLE